MTQPATIGQYVIESILGEGAMGMIYKAFDPIIGRPVAIKTIRKQLIETSGAGAAMAARFRNEARAAGRLQHSGIVGIYEYGEDVNEAFIAMEFVEGLTLAQHLANHAVRETFIAPLQINIIMAQLLSALHFAHEQGVWHRDVKPANLLITKDGKLKLADFGIARFDGVHLTQVNSRRFDIFAAGVVLYQALTNRLPFTGNQHTLTYKSVNEARKPPSTGSAVAAAKPSGQRIAPYYDLIVARALAKNPTARYQTALEFKQALADGEAAIVLPAVNAAETLKAQRALTTPRAGLVATSGAGVSNPSISSSTGLNPELLDKATTALARHMGPIANVMVRRTAANAPSRAAFCAALCEQVSDQASREALATELDKI